MPLRALAREIGCASLLFERGAADAAAKLFEQGFEALGVTHGVYCDAIDLAISPRQAREAGETTRAQIGDRLRGGDSAATTHYFHQHGLSTVGRLAI